MISEILIESVGILKNFRRPKHTRAYTLALKSRAKALACSVLLLRDENRITSLTNAPVILFGAEQAMKDDERRTNDLWGGRPMKLIG